MWSVHIFLLLASITLLQVSAKSNVFCVKPNQGSCKNNQYACQECRSLMGYVAGYSQPFQSNSILFFLPGKHNLSINSSSPVPVNISNVRNFTMEGASKIDIDFKEKVPLPTSKVFCTFRNGGVIFFNSTNVTMKNLALFDCGTNFTFVQDNNFTVHAAVSFRSCFNVTLSKVLINDSTGYGLHVDRVYSYIKVLDSAFMHSSAPGSGNPYSANARFYYGNDSREGSSLLIENSSFKHSHNHRYNGNKPDSSGLLLLIYAPSIQINISNITAEHQNSRNGGNVAFVITYFYENTSKISISNSLIAHGGAHKGAGLMCYIRLNNSNPESCFSRDRKSQDVVTVRNVHFHNNYALSGGAIYIHQHQMRHIDCTVQKITFTNCNFTHNSAKGRGKAVAIIKFEIPGIIPHNSPQFKVTFQNCRFLENKCKCNCTKIKEYGSVMALLGVESITISNSSFMNNFGTAISLVSSNLCFEGNVLFKKNSALYGGALNLCDSSLLYIRPNTIVKFVENNATYSGGAIYAEQRLSDGYPPCFYQPLLNENVNVSEFKRMVKFEYINNTAGIAGKALYGGSVDYCYTIVRYRQIKKKNLAEAMHDLAQQPGPSKVTSDPQGVRFCDPSTNEVKPDTHQIFRVFPGENFAVSASVVGQMNGSVPSFVWLEVRNRSEAHYNRIWTTRRLHSQLCRTVNISVLTKRPNVTFDLSVEKVNPAVASSTRFNDSKANATVDVIFKQCPWVFQLNTSGGCDCASILKRKVESCDINTLSFRKGKHTWVGCEYWNDSLADTTIESEVPCNQILLNTKCPEEFCSNHADRFTPSTLSQQCQEGRQGRLCGACSKNHSLALGLTTCVHNDECSLWKLPVLLLAFALAGVLFVFFLAFFNFTVSQGTMYGLFFYANIVHSNQRAFFQPGTNSVGASILRIFIAWLNLDFGFKVCFYSGMDAYQKIWLEFAFVFYILFLGVLIIFLSNKFILITRLVGRNVVNVLSTVMVFSYTKITRTCIKALMFRILKTNNQSSIQVWYYDGNVEYFRDKHIPLAMLAIILLIGTFFYMLSLLFIQCLQRRSNWFVLRWVNKLRPFFDASTGACRDHYRFWPGFLLFGLYAVFSLQTAANIDSDSHLYIALSFCVFMFVLACISPHGVYKKWPLNLLEFSFFLNLGILCALKPTFKRVYYTYISVGIAAFTFVLIVLFHGCKRVMETRKWQKLIATVRRRRFRYRRFLSVEDVSQRIQDSKIDVREVTERTPILVNIPPTVYFNRLRESLLYDD